MDYKSVCFHIGFPKCASTSLQKSLFPNLDGWEYLGRFYKDGQDSYADSVGCFVNSVCKTDSIYFDFNGFSLDDILNDPNKNYLISSELFSLNIVDRGVIAERIFSFFPDAKILILIRNQKDLLMSLFCFIVRQQGRSSNLAFGKPTIKSINEWLSDQFEFYERSAVECLRYHELVCKYIDLFGFDRVEVALFEDFAARRPVFISSIERFLGVSIRDLNVGHEKARSTRARMFYSKIRANVDLGRGVSIKSLIPSLLHGRLERFLDSGEGYGPTISETNDAALREIYSPGNRKLGVLLGRNLSSLGYYV